MTHPMLNSDGRVNLKAFSDEHMNQCPNHDLGMPEYGCNCAEGDPRWLILKMIEELEELRKSAPTPEDVEQTNLMDWRDLRPSLARMIRQRSDLEAQLSTYLEQIEAYRNFTNMTP